MFSFLKKDPKQKLNEEYLKLLEDAMQSQRNGDIKTYSLLTEKAEQIKAKMDAMQ